MRSILIAVTAIALVSAPALAGNDRQDSTASQVIDNPCDSGYEWFVKKAECRERHEPRFVEKAKCVPGSMRKVPDPDRPNGYRVLVCGWLKAPHSGS